MKTILFRADASSTIGSGHVMRCLTLAEALRKRGASAEFVCREHPGHLCDLIAARGFRVTRLPVSTSVKIDDQPRHAAWLGDSWQADMDQTRAVIAAMEPPPDWLVVDHYGIDEQWEAALRPLVGRVLAIDDLANRRHACDVLLDQNLVSSMHLRYEGKLPDGCVKLLGPEYALLQPEYAALRDRVPPRAGDVRNILVFFGGADADNFTGRALAAILCLSAPSINVHVVLNEVNPHAAAIWTLAASHPHVHVYGALPTLAPLMVKADVAVGAGGATSYERLCLGLPALVVTLAENQCPIAAGLRDRGVIRWLGHRDTVDEEVIRAAIEKIVGEGIDEAWSRACSDIVDGFGTSRVCAVLEVDEVSELRARPAILREEELVSSWQRDVDASVEHSFPRDGAEVGASANVSSFRTRLRDLDARRLYMIETSNALAIGIVEFSRIAETWTVTCRLSALARQRGLHRRVVEAGVRCLRADIPAALSLTRIDTLGLESDDRTTPTWSLAVCTDRASWINPTVARMVVGWVGLGHSVSWVHDATLLPGGDVCCYLGYERIVDAATLARYSHNLVVHASALPKGRGWSPLTWQILDGQRRIPVTLFEAADGVDSGPIYKQVHLEFTGVELLNQLRAELALASVALCEGFVAGYPESAKYGVPQTGEATFYARRRPIDGQIDIDRPLREQFNLIRTSDPERYPAWCEIDGAPFAVKLERLDKTPTSGRAPK